MKKKIKKSIAIKNTIWLFTTIGWCSLVAEGIKGTL